MMDIIRPFTTSAIIDLYHFNVLLFQLPAFTSSISLTPQIPYSTLPYSRSQMKVFLTTRLPWLVYLLLLAALD